MWIFLRLLSSIAERFPFYLSSYSSGFSKASRTVFIDRIFISYVLFNVNARDRQFLVLNQIVFILCPKRLRGRVLGPFCTFGNTRNT